MYCEQKHSHYFDAAKLQTSFISNFTKNFYNNRLWSLLPIWEKILTENYLFVTQITISVPAWLRTEDNGYFQENGEIFVTERENSFIKYRNFSISPSEIENHLLFHPAVIAVTVVPVPDLLDGQRPMAFVIKSAKYEVCYGKFI